MKKPFIEDCNFISCHNLGKLIILLQTHHTIILDLVMDLYQTWGLAFKILENQHNDI